MVHESLHTPLIVVGSAGVSLGNFHGARRFGFKVAQHGRPTDFFLIRDDGTGLRYSSVMVDLAERVEVGVIHIEEMDGTYRPDKEFLLPHDLVRVLTAQRLVIATEYGSVDSGVIMTTSNGAEIVVVSGAYPYTVAVSMQPGDVSIPSFEPEWSIDRYERKALQLKQE